MNPNLTKEILVASNILTPTIIIGIDIVIVLLFGIWILKREKK